jgi:hypothetical protein
MEPAGVVAPRQGKGKMASPRSWIVIGLIGLGLGMATHARPAPVLPRVEASDVPPGYRPEDPGRPPSNLQANPGSGISGIGRYRWSNGTQTLQVIVVAFENEAAARRWEKQSAQTSASWTPQPAGEPIRALIKSGTAKRPLVVGVEVQFARLHVGVIHSTPPRLGEASADAALVETMARRLCDRARKLGY